MWKRGHKGQTQGLGVASTLRPAPLLSFFVTLVAFMAALLFVGPVAQAQQLIDAETIEPVQETVEPVQETVEGLTEPGVERVEEEEKNTEQAVEEEVE